MPLWNELEGTRVADKFPLKRLLRSEGRTAWFATEDTQGQPAVISLFESLNDEAAVLERMKAAARIQHPSLVSIRETGSMPSEDGPLVYVIMEPFEESLADVTRERPLSTEETSEVVDSMLAALEAVHGAGMTHGHMEPASVLAAGERIKLRSDCLYYQTKDAGGRDGSRESETKDVRGLAATVYEALTQRKLGSEREASRLPAPYGSLVRAGMAQNASLADLRRVLQGPSVTTAVSAGAVGAVAAATAGTTRREPERNPDPRQDPRAAVTPDVRPVSPPVPSPVPPPAPVKPAQRTPPAATTPNRRHLADETPAADGRKKRPAVTALAVFLMVAVLMFVWWFFRHRPEPASVSGQEPATQPAPAASEPEPARPAAAMTPPATQPEPTVKRRSQEMQPSEAASAAMGAPGASPATPVATPATPTVPTTTDNGSGHDVWHVIVYTFNHQEQAQRRAEAMAAAHANLQPQVFTPTGSAPYFVALGGAMSRKEAYFLRNRARASGLPQDTYMQNYAR